MNEYLKYIFAGFVGGLIGGLLVVLVGGSQSVQTVVKETKEVLGAVGSNFPNGILADYLSFPPKDSDSALGLTTHNTVRRCQIASGSDTCELVNYSGVDWIINPRLWVSGAATNSRAKFFVATSTFALSGSWWNGVGSSSLKHAPISLGVSTTTPFDRIGTFGTTSAVSSVIAGTYPGGLFILNNGDRVTCAVTQGTHRTGDRGFWERATSTSFSYRGNCAFEIVATSTPDTTPER